LLLCPIKKEYLGGNQGKTEKNTRNLQNGLAGDGNQTHYGVGFPARYKDSYQTLGLISGK